MIGSKSTNHSVVGGWGRSYSILESLVTGGFVRMNTANVGSLSEHMGKEH